MLLKLGKPKDKRSVIASKRLRELSQPNSVYVVSCYDDEYYCKSHPDGRCYRGFFSLYLQAVFGIAFAKKINIPVYIDYGNLGFSYSDEKIFGNKNFWDNYFSQQTLQDKYTPVLNRKLENFPLKIWDRGFLKDLSLLVAEKIVLHEELKKELGELKGKMEAKSTLGIHIRKTDHSDEVKSVEDAVFFRKVKKLAATYERLFIATDDKRVILDYQAKFPGKVIFHDCIRSSDKHAIHQNPENFGYELGRQAILDCYSLSFCDKVLLSPSNLSYAALLLNPEIPYTVVDSWDSKFHRYKTLAAFYLNKWGIRKW